MKRLFVLLLALILVMGAAVALYRVMPVREDSDVGSFAVEPTHPYISLQKTVFEVGEPILVRLYSDNPMDKVVLSKSTDSIPIYRWQYVGPGTGTGDGVGSGVQFDLLDSYCPTTAYAGDIPAGDYVLFLRPWSGSLNSDVYDAVHITIVPAT